MIFVILMIREVFLSAVPENFLISKLLLSLANSMIEFDYFHLHNLLSFLCSFSPGAYSESVQLIVLFLTVSAFYHCHFQNVLKTIVSVCSSKECTLSKEASIRLCNDEFGKGFSVCFASGQSRTEQRRWDLHQSDRTKLWSSAPPAIDYPSWKATPGWSSVLASRVPTLGRFRNQYCSQKEKAPLSVILLPNWVRESDI